jgi:hypothetical protein
MLKQLLDMLFLKLNNIEYSDTAIRNYAPV